MNRRRGRYNHQNPYGGYGPMDGAGMVMDGPQSTWATGSRTRNTIPTGGKVAKGMKINPYLTPTGFRKPRQDEIKQEIQLFHGIQRGAVDLVDGVNEIQNTNMRARHICVIKPYIHFLQLRVYQVTLPEVGNIGVQYFVHDCGKLIIDKQTMP